MFLKLLCGVFLKLQMLSRAEQVVNPVQRLASRLFRPTKCQATGSYERGEDPSASSARCRRDIEQHCATSFVPILSAVNPIPPRITWILAWQAPAGIAVGLPAVYVTCFERVLPRGRGCQI